MIRDDEGKTATPVLPLSALAVVEAASARPLRAAARPPAAPPAAGDRPVPAPRTAAPLEDWSLELRPPQPDHRAPRPEAPPHGSALPGADVSGLAASARSSSGARALAGSLLLVVAAFALGALPLVVWRGRIADPYDRLLIVQTELSAATAALMFGPPLLVALAAGILLAWWLRRG
jgi:hypothetical protein